MEKDTLFKLLDSGKSINSIATEVGCSVNKVAYWVRKHGLHSKCEKFSVQKYRCKCGETNPRKFYGHKKKICAKCHSKATLQLAKEKREKAIKFLGSKCVAPDCGFNRWTCSLDIHHLDPNKKDPNFKTMRHWSWERIEKEIAHCVLLCRNCHTAYHNGELKLTDLKPSIIPMVIGN